MNNEYLISNEFHKLEKITTSDNIQNIILIGMGASTANSKALASFLEIKKKLIFIDSLEIEIIDQKLLGTDVNNSIIVAISKSGSTDETNYILKYILEEKLNNAICYVITENYDSDIVQIGNISKNYNFFEYEKSISGRFSVLKSSSFFPLILAGLPINKLPKLEDDDQSFLDLAQNLIKNYQDGRNILIISIYNQKYLGFAQWLCQIIAESLGKNGYGMTPVISIGSCDEHSQLQLYLDGPDDKLFYIIPNEYEPDQPILNPLKIGYDIRSSQAKHQKAFLNALRKSNRPIIIEEQISVNLTYKWMRAIIHISNEKNINPFNQPAVDDAKKLFL